MSNTYLWICESKVHEMIMLSSFLENCDSISFSFSNMYRVPVATAITDLVQHVFLSLIKLVSIPAKKEHINLPIMLA